ncbi:hypothetical protein ACIPW4_24110 [Pseudomonas sp. NPDC089996]|uniref:hypothetical protein n=1 Tax=Pseudomonas sp. NPDC089996 TaxID=3364474 RepID=UPI003816B4CF
MRGYMELVDFMKALGDGLLVYLPDDQRVGQLSVEEIIEQWMAKKSYFSARALRKDIAIYIALQKSGDFTVDEILSWYDLSFIPERFGVEENVFFTRILGLIESHVAKKKKALLAKCCVWLRCR